MEQAGVDSTREKEITLAKRLAQGLSDIPAVRIHGPSSWDNRLAIIMTTIPAMVPEDVGDILDGDYGIAVEPGCTAPLGHQYLKTFPTELFVSA